MNSFELDEILKKARKRRLDEHPAGQLKTVLAKADFESRGQHYLKGGEYELTEEEAKALVANGQVDLWRGGYCDVSQVKRIGKEMLYAYRSWRFGPPPATDKDAFADTMIRVRLNKPQQVVIGVPLQPGDEFFMPYGELRNFECELEDDPDGNWLRTLTVLADQE